MRSHRIGPVIKQPKDNSGNQQEAAARMVPLEDLRLLASHGLELKNPGRAADQSFRIHGDTFPHDALLTEAGGTWDSAEQVWLLSSDRELTRFLEELSSVNQLSNRGLNEERIPFDNDNASQSLVKKLLEYGPHAVSNEELLTLILSFDQYITHPADTSRALLADFGTLGQILCAPTSRLAKFDGTSPRTIALLRAIQLVLERTLNEPLLRSTVIGSWKALLDYIDIRLKNSNKEHSIILYLDSKNRLLKEEENEGTINHVPLYPREIASRALELCSSSLILVHNHPSGDPSPSEGDIKMTRQLQIGLSALEIVLHDHIIIGQNKHFSFKEESLI